MVPSQETGTFKADLWSAVIVLGLSDRSALGGLQRYGGDTKPTEVIGKGNAVVCRLKVV